VGRLWVTRDLFAPFWETRDLFAPFSVGFSAKKKVGKFIQ
jgi:hypothetical protein